MKATSDRFWAKVDRTGECWIWTGAIASTGYGDFHVGRDGDRYVRTTAHRWAYESINGPIPPGLQIDHLCRVRSCVRPDHLEAVSAGENLRRGWEHRIADACQRGHAFTPENTGTNSVSGHRFCKECSREHKRAYKRRGKSPNPAQTNPA